MSALRMRLLVAESKRQGVDLSKLFVKYTRLPDPAARKQELRDALRALDEAIDDACVASLFAILAMRAEGELSAREASRMGAVVSKLDAEELLALHKFLEQALAIVPETTPRLFLMSRQPFDDGKYTSAVSFGAERHPVSLCGPATRLFRLLRENDLAASDLTWGGGGAVGPDIDTETPIESISMLRRHANILHRVLGA
jgi:hypothetical protein